MSYCGPPFYGPGPCFPAPFYPNGSLYCGPPPCPPSCPPSCTPSCPAPCADVYAQRLLVGTGTSFTNTGTFVPFSVQGLSTNINYISSTGLQVPCPGRYDVEYDIYHARITEESENNLLLFGISLNGAVPTYLTPGNGATPVSLHGQQILSLGQNSVVGLMNMSLSPVTIGQPDSSITNSLAAQMTINKID